MQQFSVLKLNAKIEKDGWLWKKSISPIGKKAEWVPCYKNSWSSVCDEDLYKETK